MVFVDVVGGMPYPLIEVLVIVLSEYDTTSIQLLRIEWLPRTPGDVVDVDLSLSDLCASGLARLQLEDFLQLPSCLLEACPCQAPSPALAEWSPRSSPWSLDMQTLRG